MAAAAILNFIFVVHFGQMVYFLQNFIYLRQSAAELLLLVQKSKMETPKGPILRKITSSITSFSHKWSWLVFWCDL